MSDGTKDKGQSGGLPMSDRPKGAPQKTARPKGDRRGRGGKGRGGGAASKDAGQPRSGSGKGGRPSPRPDRSTPSQRAARIERDLMRLVRDLVTALDAPVSGPGLAPEVEISLRIPLTDGAPGGPRLMDVVYEELEARARLGAPVANGRAYCFQCESEDCTHAQPPDARSVFLKYAATGKPVWREFTEACLTWGEPRVGSLYGEPPALIAVQRAGEALNDELIDGFGRGDRGYRLLGQVACGYLALSGGSGGVAPRAALTVQVIGSRDRGGPLRLHLNILAGEAPSASADADTPGRSGWWERRGLVDAVRDARQQLAALELRLRGRKRAGLKKKLEPGVEAVLNRLRTGLERQHRPQSHRTRHARDRIEQGDRPTHVAIADAERAPDDRVFYEPDRDTVIVIGPKGRVHAFSRDGRHVTSLHQRRDAIERKLDRKTWVPCEPRVLKPFRDAIAALRGGRRD